MLFLFKQAHKQLDTMVIKPTKIFSNIRTYLKCLGE